MKLDLDCVRAILLAVESFDYGERVTYSRLREKLPDYEEDAIQYACLKLKQEGFIDAVVSSYLCPKCTVVSEISEITYEGHQFLNSIRDSKTWSAAKKVGGSSLRALWAIAQEILIATLLP